MSINSISMGLAATSVVADLITSKFNISLEGKTPDEINNEIKEQNVSLELAQQQARVAQELAIAARIETAEEVEIEEFYDNSGDGNVGLKTTKESLSFGIGGSGRKITKRIYKFKGHNGEKIEVYQQKLSEILSPKAQTNED